MISISARAAVCAAMLIHLAARPALAQTPAGAWEVEAYGGIGAAHAGTKAPALPPAGPSLDTLSPTFPTRAVPSWFFGDGATQFNSVQTDFGLAAPIAPLDTALSARAAAHGGVFGARIRRVLSSRFALEGGVDVLLGSGDAAAGLRNVADGASASFKAGFTALLATGPFTGVSVASTASTSIRARHDVAVTGALSWTLRPHAAWAPYRDARRRRLARRGRLCHGDARRPLSGRAARHHPNRRARPRRRALRHARRASRRGRRRAASRDQPALGSACRCARLHRRRSHARDG